MLQIVQMGLVCPQTGCARMGLFMSDVPDLYEPTGSRQRAQCRAAAVPASRPLSSREAGRMGMAGRWQRIVSGRRLVFFLL